MLRNFLHRVPLFFTPLIERFSNWVRARFSVDAFLYIVGVVMGIVTGATAALLKWCVVAVRELVFNSFNIDESSWTFVVMPIIGIFLATIFTKYIIRQPMEHGSSRITQDMATGNNDLSPRLILGPVIGCSLTLGFGGSAGAEDPVAYSGAAIGSNIGKAFKVDRDYLADMVGYGAAAGIAGIFMAPIGGVMFALEVLKMKQSLQSVITMTLTCLASALTCFILLGCHTDVSFVPSMLFDTRLIPWVLLCGVLCGLYSVYYAYVLRLCRRIFGKFKNIWLKALTGALTLAVLLFLFPSLYGEGYHVMGKLMIDDPMACVSHSPFYKLGLDYNVLLILMCVLVAIKPFATASTNDSGGVGGDFTPTFYAGAIVGFLFAAVLNHFFGMHLPYSLFAFFGMAGVMSGAVMAPLMAIFICAEMTGLYGFILPLTLVAIASILTTAALSKFHFTTLPFLHNTKKQKDEAPAGSSK